MRKQQHYYAIINSLARSYDWKSLCFLDKSIYVFRSFDYWFILLVYEIFSYMFLLSYKIKQQLENREEFSCFKTSFNENRTSNITCVRAYKQHEFLIVPSTAIYLLRYRCLTKTKGAWIKIILFQLQHMSYSYSS